MMLVTTLVLSLAVAYVASAVAFALHTLTSVFSFGAQAGARLARASDAMPSDRASLSDRVFGSSLFLAWLKFGQVVLYAAIVIALFA